MTGEVDIYREWTGTVAPQRMGAHGDEYAAAAGPLGSEAIGASWGDTSLISECATALGLGARYLHEALTVLGSTMQRYGDGMHTAGRNITDAEHGSAAAIDRTGEPA
ncbi:hypothetical protein FH608_003690 [Nonomuraea phyllanthi]|uniref:Uncharacterized protein n=1 Tax=Nonomuraea phyllanthi TaxID=2219224 RepID=A0A5C4WW25_9ACTN|nr:hypothetical protein [Nonomuraea phyllanthi]KAB8197647.1 hypothetical protein FH608_003690 [Nonomuraea phyllanthi]